MSKKVSIRERVPEVGQPQRRSEMRSSCFSRARFGMGQEEECATAEWPGKIGEVECFDDNC